MPTSTSKASSRLRTGARSAESGPDAALSVETLDRIDAIEPQAWDALAGADAPFLRHAFLSTLEQTGCVGAGTGWQPRHLLLRDGRGRIRAALPQYRKSHSWGEFVFDWAWAEAYQRLGLDYYPKLTVAVPFTPASGARILLGPGEPAPLRRAALEAAREQCAALGASSLHVLFPLTAELEALAACGFALREDCQFQWRNRGYADFEAFLAGFSSAKRKKVRRERRRVAEAGIDFVLREGEALAAADWQLVYALYCSTYDRRGMTPYLTESFFPALAAKLPHSVLVLEARLGGATVAMALFLRGSRTLYGRYWGCVGDFHSLHFETCYYRGIDYCIEHGLERFEPGTQGEHKLVRGFEPTLTWSAHWLADARLRGAVEHYLLEERRQVERYAALAAAHLPWRAGEAGGGGR